MWSVCKRRSESSTAVNAVIDGKQRFEAIFDFFQGRIALAPGFVFAERPSLAIGGLSYKDLKANHPSVASRFDNYNLTVMSVITDEEGRINELFVRLNRNKTLTGPEIRNAMRGVVPQLTRRIAESEFVRSRIRFETQRGQDLDLAAKLLLVEFRGRLVETKRVALDRFAQEGVDADAKASDFERAADRVEGILADMAEIFIERDPLLSNQGPLVPYYWLVRSTPKYARHLIRPFLVMFDDLRRANRRMASEPESVQYVDPTLTRYDALSRSINDPGSIEGRYEILATLFEKHIGLNGRLTAV